MKSPTTELDARYSDPDTAPTSWDHTRDAIEQAELFWISTVRPDGRPHVSPLVVVWLSDAAYFSTGPEEQKAHNLDANPCVALTTGTNAWQEGLDIVIEGCAQQVTDRDLLTRLTGAWAAKWDGRWQYTASDSGFTHPGP